MTETEKIADVLCLLRSGKGQVYTHDLIVHGKLPDTGLGLTLAGIIHIVTENYPSESVFKFNKDIVWNACRLAVETDCRKAVGGKGHSVFLTTGQKDIEAVTGLWKALLPNNLRKSPEKG